MERLKRQLTFKSNQTVYDFLAKIIILGNSSVGKTNILLRFVDQAYSINHIPTIGVDFKSKIVQVPANENNSPVKIKLQLWDTAGQQKFMTFTDTYFKGVSGVIVVYSIDDKQSFQNIKDWMNQIQINNAGNLPKLLIGNKFDLSEQRKVSQSQGKMLADSYNCAFLQTSAKQNINITQALNYISKSIVNNFHMHQQYKNSKIDKVNKSQKISLTLINHKKSTFCCT